MIVMQHLAYQITSTIYRMHQVVEQKVKHN